MQRLIKILITGLGAKKFVVALLLVLIVVVILLSSIISMLMYGEVVTEAMFVVVVATLITAPFGLYIFSSLILKLNNSEARLRCLSISDDLTGVYNRRYFIEQAEKELSKAKRYGNIFSIVLLDIDNFKSINDAYGHFGGDAVIKALALSCNQHLRSTDIFARYGGEEFVFLVPESDKSDMHFFAERVRQRLEKIGVNYHGEDIYFTVSLGVKTFDVSIDSLELMLKKADAALYEAKRAGKNCVVVYD